MVLEVQIKNPYNEGLFDLWLCREAKKANSKLRPTW